MITLYQILDQRIKRLINEIMYIGNLILIVGNFSDILFKEFLNNKRKAGIWKEPCKMGIWM